MRYEDYLIEQDKKKRVIVKPVFRIPVKSKIGLAKNIIASKLDKLYDSLSEKDFNVKISALAELMQEQWHTFQILFDVGTGPTKKKRYGRNYGDKFISQGNSYNDAKGTIMVDLRPRAAAFFFQYRDPARLNHFFDVEKNPFWIELTGVLAHELAHREQWKKYSKLVDMEGPKFGKDTKGYLADETEILAFAQQAANEFIHGKISKTANMYLSEFDTSEEPWKKFEEATKRIYKKETGEELEMQLS